MPRCGEEEVKNEGGRREWAREEGMRWDSGRVDDEGRPSWIRWRFYPLDFSAPEHNMIRFLFLSDKWHLLYAISCSPTTFPPLNLP